MTGISSFTGCHIARALTDQGHEVHGTLTRPKEAYESELFRVRLQWAQPSQLFENAAFGRPDFFQILNSPYDIFIHHGWPTTGHREEISDLNAVVEQNFVHAKRVLQTLRQGNPSIRVLHTGTVYEEGEGQSCPEAVNTYGTIKSLVWKELKNLCCDLHIPLTKVVIPNPIGPFEGEQKLISSFFRDWRREQVPVLKAPHLIRDNIFVERLGHLYVDALRSDSDQILHPSGWIGSNHQLIILAQKAAEKILKRKLKFDIQSESSFPEKMLKRVNSDRSSNHVSDEEVINYIFKWKSHEI